MSKRSFVVSCIALRETRLARKIGTDNCLSRVAVVVGGLLGAVVGNNVDCSGRQQTVNLAQQIHPD